MSRGHKGVAPNSYRSYVLTHYCRCTHHLRVHDEKGHCTVKNCICKAFKMKE